MRLRILSCGALLSVASTSPTFARDLAPENTPDSTDEAPESPSQEADEAPADTSTPASSEDRKRASARALATDASQDYRMGRFADAYEKFNRAFRLVEVPALGVWSARSLRQLDRFVEASERYREVIKTGAPADASASDQQAIRDARAELDELSPRIPQLAIELEHAKAEDVEVTMDDDVLDSALIGAKMQVNPGKHVIVATRGDERIERTITVREGTVEALVLPFKPGYEPPKRDASGNIVTVNVQQGFTPLETVGIVVMSGGGALLIAGVATTVVALGQQEELRDNCTGGRCPPEFHEKVDAFGTMKFVSTSALVGGAVLGGVGAALYFSGAGSKKDGADDGVALYVRGTTMGLRGAF